MISSFKGLFGNFVRAVRWKYIVQEMTLKVGLYNKLLSIQREAMAMAWESICMQPQAYEHAGRGSCATNYIVGKFVCLIIYSLNF